MTVIKTVKLYSIDKNWMTREVDSLLRHRNVVFASGDTEEYIRTKHVEAKGIRDVKKAFGRKLSTEF